MGRGKMRYMCADIIASCTGACVFEQAIHLGCSRRTVALLAFDFSGIQTPVFDGTAVASTGRAGTVAISGEIAGLLGILCARSSCAGKLQGYVAICMGYRIGICCAIGEAVTFLAGVIGIYRVTLVAAELKVRSCLAELTHINVTTSANHCVVGAPDRLLVYRCCTNAVRTLYVTVAVSST
jgi:hypothetical protein